MKNNPLLVTIGIPTRNRSSLLRQALLSALNQTYRAIEVIVSDNASVDDTAVVLAEFCDSRLVVVRNCVDIGMVGNWNKCLEMANGEFFILLSDDDILRPNAVELLASAYQSEAVTLSYGRVQYIDEHLNVSTVFRHSAPAIESGQDFLFNALRERRVAYPSATLFRTSDARRIGGYPDVGTTTDLALLAVITINGDVSFSNEVIATYRIHSNAESFTENAIASQWKLFKWITSSNCLLTESAKSDVQDYCRTAVFRWGRAQAVRGNLRGSKFAGRLLREMKARWSFHFWLVICTLLPVRWGARIRRSILVLKNAMCAK